MKYKYKGLTQAKERVSGSLEADSELAARYKLRSMKIRPFDLVAQPKPFGLDFTRLNEITIGPIVNLKGMVVFTRQLSSLIDAGIPVVQSLDILSQQETRPAFKKILLKIKEAVESGSTLAKALSEHPKVFSNLFVSLVEAGEVSGTLEVTLRRIGTQFEKLDRIRSKVKQAMAYPVITLVIAIAVLMFLLVKVIPEVSKLYTESSAELPALTQFVLGLSEWIQTHFVLIVGVLSGCVVGMFLLLRWPTFRKVWDPFILKVPLIGSLITKSMITRFARTLSTLISSGVPLLQGFDIAANLIENLALRTVVEKTAAGVAEGKTVAAGLAQATLFPPMVLHMVSVGEVTGKLDEMLGKVADIYEDEVDDAITILTGLIQPALIICVGGLIAFLLMAMYLPIFQLAEKVSGGI